MRALIDTCVVVDALQNREQFCKDAQEIFLLAANKIVSGYISAKATTDIYYLSHRLLHDDKASREILGKLFALFDVLDTEGTDCKKAVFSNISDYEDAVMIETAIRTEMDCIVTRNVKDYEKSPVAVYSPQEFLKIVKAE